MMRRPTAFLLAWWLLWAVSPTNNGIQGPFPTRDACEQINVSWLAYLGKRVALRQMPEFECVSDAVKR